MADLPPQHSHPSVIVFPSSFRIDHCCDEDELTCDLSHVPSQQAPVDIPSEARESLPPTLDSQVPRDNSGQRGDVPQHHFDYDQGVQGGLDHDNNGDRQPSPIDSVASRPIDLDGNNNHEEDGRSSSSSSPSGLQQKPKQYSPEDVINRIEQVTEAILDMIHTGEEPILRSLKQFLASGNDNDSDVDDTSRNNDQDGNAFSRKFNMAQCRPFTNVMLVLSFVHSLLLAKRTTTTREVYYFYVTHFRSQRECDAAILDAAKLLCVPRINLGVTASPKGWFCGCIQITRQATAKTMASTIDGTALSSIQGLPITREWIDRSSTLDGAMPDFHISSQGAKCVLVIEKEGVYNRLSEDRFFERYSCILVTGKGFPDLATRALVHTLHTELGLPVYGVCDQNPYGISILQVYQWGSKRMGMDGGKRYSVPIKWLGLRPSHTKSLKDQLPRDVYQRLTDLDTRRIESLCEETSPFVNVEGGEKRLEEIRTMKEMGFKVELEALNWLGMDSMTDWIEEMLWKNEEGIDELDEEEAAFWSII